MSRARRGYVGGVDGPPGGDVMTRYDAARVEDATDGVEARVVLRPIATPLPLGFLALGVATFSFAALQLQWIPSSEGHTIALAVLVLTVPLQLLAAVMGFLARDPV